MDPIVSDELIKALLKRVDELSESVKALESDKAIQTQISSFQNDDILKTFKSLTFKRKTGKAAKPLLESEIRNAQAQSKSAAGAARYLKVSYPTYRKYADMYKIHDHFCKDLKGIKKVWAASKGKFPLDEILEGKFPEYPIYRLKDRVIRSGKKLALCEQCGFKERRITDGKIPILLNFNDGNVKNHKLENLQMLCYNCTFTSGKGFISRGAKTFDPDKLQGSEIPIDARY